jgi:hypothetical protein
MRADTQRTIFKIHGDWSTPHDVVLTGADYRELEHGKPKDFIADKLFAVLSMFDVVIVGYSATDPDFLEQLQRAKKVASPKRPVFMFASGVDTTVAQSLLLEYNVRIIGYANPDGHHVQLLRLLEQYDPFVCKRGSRYLVEAPPEDGSSETAASLYLFTSLRLLADGNPVSNACGALILLALAASEAGTIGLVALPNALLEKAGVRLPVDPESLFGTATDLVSRGLAVFSGPGQSLLTLTPEGRRTVAVATAQRQENKDRFLSAARNTVLRAHPETTPDAAREISETAARVLSGVFRRRGLEIARTVLEDFPVDLAEAPDILALLNTFSSSLPAEQQGSFFELMVNVLTNPSPEMKPYMASLTQGYFAYHVLGLDPKCSTERLAHARDKCWVMDASILIKALARECRDNAYALDLVQRMLSLGLRCTTTEALIDEVSEHAQWGITLGQELGDVPERILAWVSSSEGSSNLFVDGYIHWATDGRGNPRFADYMRECLGDYEHLTVTSCVKRQLTGLGMQITHIAKELQNVPVDSAELTHLADEIQTYRKARGTYKNEHQCQAEAEVLWLAMHRPTVFLSQSYVLNHVLRSESAVSWTPEAVYRFTTLFGDTPSNPEAVYESMLDSPFGNGLDVVDHETMRKYADPLIAQTRMAVQQELDNYERALAGKATARVTMDDFDKVPDEQKPLYSVRLISFLQRQIAQETARLEQAAHASQMNTKEGRDYVRLKSEERRRQEKKNRQLRKKASQPRHKGAHH